MKERIRKATKEDASRLAEILIFTKRATYRPIFQEDQVSFGEMQVLPLALEYQENEKKRENIWVYDDGFVKAMIHIEGRQVCELYVDVFFQKEGIGAKLMDFAVNVQGADHLWVLEKNERAIRFYRHYGFAMTEERKPEEGTKEFVRKMVRIERSLKMKYRQIVFDVDGTLVDNEEAILRSLQDVMLEVKGEKIPFEELTFCLGIPGEDALERLQVESIPQVMERWVELLAQYGDQVSLYEGIEELLSRLSGEGYGLGIVSSRTREMLEEDACIKRIRAYFSVTVCADDSVGHKPTADPLLKYMELSGAGKEEILYIGDSVHDSQCAENAGVDFGLAVWGSHKETIRADYYLHSPLAVPEQLP